MLSTSKPAPETGKPETRQPGEVPGGSYNVDEEFVEEHSAEQAPQEVPQS